MAHLQHIVNWCEWYLYIYCCSVRKGSLIKCFHFSFPSNQPHTIYIHNIYCTMYIFIYILCVFVLILHLYLFHIRLRVSRLFSWKIHRDLWFIFTGLAATINTRWRGCAASFTQMQMYTHTHTYTLTSRLYLLGCCYFYSLHFVQFTSQGDRQRDRP